MKRQERQTKFTEAIQEIFGHTRHDKLNVGWGVSNQATGIESGIQLGVFNVESIDAQAGQYIQVSCLGVPPYSQVYFGLQIKTHLDQFKERLKHMLDCNAAGDSRYGNRNNNVRTYLAEDGNLYLLNKGEWSDLSQIDLSQEGPPIAPDRIVVAVYPPELATSRRLAAQDVIAYIERCVGSDRVLQIEPWTEVNSLPQSMHRSPASVSVQEIRQSIELRGSYFPAATIERYHSGMNFHPRKHFVILSGLSGTGKTRLALEYATAIHGSAFEPAANPHLFICPVRPDWTEPSGLLGYLDVLSGRYIVPPFLTAILRAAAHPSSPVFVVLDELNLARVEHYLSDILSAMESGGSLRLHSGSTPLPGDSGEEIRGEMSLPSNLYITGTINIDESTLPISDKVLDRAVIIDMSHVDTSEFLSMLAKRESTLATACSQCKDLLGKANGIMSEHRQGFGYRTIEEFVRYFAFSTEIVQRSGEDTLDELFVQKIFPKLRGSERQRGMLDELRNLTNGMAQSQALLAKLTEDLDEFGSFQNSR